MRFDRPVYEGTPAGRVAMPTPAQLALMHRSFLAQAAAAERAGEPKDAARWRKLAEGARAV